MSYPLGGPNPRPNVGLDQNVSLEFLRSAPIRRPDTNPDPGHVNDPPGPHTGYWLDPPPFSQDVDITAVMVALHQTGVVLRTAMHEAQQADRAVQVAATKAEAQDIRNSAVDSFSAALAAGVGQIVGGAMDIAGAADAFRTAGFPDEAVAPTKLPTDDDVEGDEVGGAGGRTQIDEGYEADDDEEDLEGAGGQRSPEDQKAEELEKLKENFEEATKQKSDQEIRFKKADIRLQAWAGLGKVAMGAGQVGAAVYEFQSKQQDAAEKDDEAKALKAQATVEDQDNLLKNIDDLLSSTRQTFSQIIQARNDAVNRITQV